jgi:hypothetical protein
MVLDIEEDDVQLREDDDDDGWKVTLLVRSLLIFRARGYQKHRSSGFLLLRCVDLMLDLSLTPYLRCCQWPWFA